VLPPPERFVLVVPLEKSTAVEEEFEEGSRIGEPSSSSSSSLELDGVYIIFVVTGHCQGRRLSFWAWRMHGP
jgi:hypothetical protein